VGAAPSPTLSAGRCRVGALYGLLVRFLSLVVSIFFRTIEVVGREHVPAEGPVIFVGNHPNSLLDPVLITTTCGRKVHFAAKDTLFRPPGLRTALGILGAVPVRRRTDHPDGALDNRTMFDALYAILHGGGACGIFPEGISHAGSELAPLKTGAARIALGATADRPDDAASVQVVPCGLSYFRRTRMRSRVLVQFGPPIEVDEERLAAWRADERATVRDLTDDIETGLRALTINAPDFDTLHVLDGVRRLYVPSERRLPLAEQAELSRRFLDHYGALHEEPEIAALYADVEDYLRRLDQAGLSDAQLSAPLSDYDWLRRLGGHALLLFLYAPLAIPGLLIHLPVLIAAVVAGDGLTGRKDVIATTKVMTLTLLVPGVYAAILTALAVWVGWPWWALLLVGLALPASGWATIRVLERQAALRHGLRTLVTLLVLPREVERLRERRLQLRTQIWSVVDRYADPDMERIVTPK